MYSLFFLLLLLRICVGEPPFDAPNPLRRTASQPLSSGQPRDNALPRSDSAQPAIGSGPPEHPASPLGRATSLPSGGRGSGEANSRTAEGPSLQHWPSEARETFRHLQQAPEPVQEGVRKKLRASLRNDVIDPVASYSYRRKVEEPFVGHEAVRQHLGRPLEGQHPEPPHHGEPIAPPPHGQHPEPAHGHPLERQWSTLEQPWQQLAANARGARNRLGQTAGLGRQAQALEHLPAPQAVRRGRDMRLAQNAQRNLPRIEGEAREYHRLATVAARFPHRDAEQRHAAHQALDAAEHRALEGRLRTDRLSAADRARLQDLGAEPGAPAHHQRLWHEHIGREIALNPHNYLGNFGDPRRTPHRFALVGPRDFGAQRQAEEPRRHAQLWHDFNRWRYEAAPDEARPGEAAPAAAAPGALALGFRRRRAFGLRGPLPVAMPLRNGLLHAPSPPTPRTPPPHAPLMRADSRLPPSEGSEPPRERPARWRRVLGLGPRRGWGSHAPPPAPPRPGVAGRVRDAAARARQRLGGVGPRVRSAVEGVAERRRERRHDAHEAAARRRTLHSAERRRHRDELARRERRRRERRRRERRHGEDGG